MLFVNQSCFYYNVWRESFTQAWERYISCTTFIYMSVCTYLICVAESLSFVGMCVVGDGGWCKSAVWWFWLCDDPKKGVWRSPYMSSNMRNKILRISVWTHPLLDNSTNLIFWIHFKETDCSWHHTFTLHPFLLHFLLHLPLRDGLQRHLRG